MQPSVIAAFWAVSILFVLTPGADWAHAIAAGLRGRAVVPAVAGLLSGHLLAIGLVAAGVGAMFARAPVALHILTVLGALYLLWLGIGLLRHPPAAAAEAEQTVTGWRHWALKGACVSGLNPKVLLLFLALLPQFISAGAAWAMPVQILALGLVHLVSCAAVYLAVWRRCRAAHPPACITRRGPRLGRRDDPDRGALAQRNRHTLTPRCSPRGSFA